MVYKKGGNIISNFYAVVKGRCTKPKIYKSWSECEKVVIGYPCAIYKKFDNEEKAIEFIKFHGFNYKKSPKTKLDSSQKKLTTKKELDLKHEIYEKVRKSDNGTVGENIVSTYLRYFNIKYELQHEVQINNHKHLFDFAIFENMKLIAFIEYDGIQHTKAIEEFGGENGLKLRQERDNEKNQYCLSKNIKLVRIAHNKANKIESIIKEEVIPLFSKPIKNKKVETQKKKTEKISFKINCKQLSEILKYQVTMDLLNVWTVSKNLKNSNKSMKTILNSVIRKGKSFEVIIGDKKYIISK